MRRYAECSNEIALILSLRVFAYLASDLPVSRTAFEVSLTFYILRLEIFQYLANFSWRPLDKSVVTRRITPYATPARGLAILGQPGD